MIFNKIFFMRIKRFFFIFRINNVVKIWNCFNKFIYIWICLCKLFFREFFLFIFVLIDLILDFLYLKEFFLVLLM